MGQADEDMQQQEDLTGTKLAPYYPKVSQVSGQMQNAGGKYYYTPSAALSSVKTGPSTLMYKNGFGDIGFSLFSPHMGLAFSTFLETSVMQQLYKMLRKMASCRATADSIDDLTLEQFRLSWEGWQLDSILLHADSAAAGIASTFDPTSMKKGLDYGWGNFAFVNQPRVRRLLSTIATSVHSAAESSRDDGSTSASLIARRLLDWSNSKLGELTREIQSAIEQSEHISDAHRKLLLGPGTGLGVLSLLSQMEGEPMLKGIFDENKVVMPSSCTYEQYKTNGMCAAKSTVLDGLIGADKLNLHLRMSRGEGPNVEGALGGAFALSGSFVNFIRTPTECTADSECTALGAGIKCFDFTALYDDNIFDTHQGIHEDLLLKEGNSAPKLGTCLGKSTLRTEIKAFVNVMLGGKPLAQYLGTKSDVLKYCAPDFSKVEQTIKDNIDTWVDELPPAEQEQTTNGVVQKWYSFSHLVADTEQLGYPGEKTSSPTPTQVVDKTLVIPGYTVDTFDNEARSAFVTSYAGKAGVLRNQVTIRGVSASATQRRTRARNLADGGVDVDVQVVGVEAEKVASIQAVTATSIVEEVLAIQKAYIPPEEDAEEAKADLEIFFAANKVALGLTDAQVTTAVATGMCLF
jgi:hypothetical protein